MRAALLDTLATQMPFVLQFEARDAGKRLAATFAVCAAMTYFGLVEGAVQSLAMIRVWNWLAIAPPALCVLVVAYLLGNGQPDDVPDWDHILIWIGALATIVNTVEVVFRQHDNRTAFAKAQVAAAERLERLEYLSRHDKLTGLLNRRAFDELLSDGLLMSSERPVAVLMIDLDGFKPVNDTWGHAAGDAVLVELAERLRSLVAVGHIARLGGDEFGIIVDGSDPDAVGELARYVRDACGTPLEFQGERISVGASVGIAICGPGDSLKTVCARADRAMYRAKSGGLAHPVFDTADVARAG